MSSSVAVPIVSPSRRPFLVLFGELSLVASWPLIHCLDAGKVGRYEMLERLEMKALEWNSLSGEIDEDKIIVGKWDIFFKLCYFRVCFLFFVFFFFF